MSNYMDRVQALQKEMHAFIEGIMTRNPNIPYQDCVTTFFLHRIIQLEDALKELKPEKKRGGPVMGQPDMDSFHSL